MSRNKHICDFCELDKIPTDSLSVIYGKNITGDLVTAIHMTLVKLAVFVNYCEANFRVLVSCYLVYNYFGSIQVQCRRIPVFLKILVPAVLEAANSSI